MNGTERREAIIDAFMGLLADRPFEEATVRAIADAAGVTLSELHAEFPTRGHIIAAFSRRIDGVVLAADTSDMAGESPRDRLFDVLMSRLDALRPYRAAIRALGRAAGRDPGLALALNMIATESMGWMLAAARLSAQGWRGRLAVQGLAVSFARVLRVFVSEDDAGMPRTMAALDRALKEAEQSHGRFARLFGRAVRDDGGAASYPPPAPATPEPADAGGGAASPASPSPASPEVSEPPTSEPLAEAAAVPPRKTRAPRRRNNAS